MDKKFFDALDAEADDLAADLRQRTLSLENPELGDMFELAYADQTNYLRGQQERYRAYAESFELDASGVGEEA